MVKLKLSLLLLQILWQMGAQATGTEYVTEIGTDFIAFEGSNNFVKLTDN